ncbi:hypothetical protein B0T10DRAFT_562067 [Thelonectria olida]|uniref:Ecp2 effector protein-like domain-containing protein n=1 Tax=Thelonectria olida TaxID=1576542 RepID=A0A9P9ANR3_9HYPO|nr:hypothetical protein B0T10DRAFT_562067 [Thelonectria olida]
MVAREITNPEGQTRTLLIRDFSIEERDVEFMSAPTLVPSNGDQCGDSTFELTGDENAKSPNIDDCNDLASGLRGMDQHWELNNWYAIATDPDWLDLVSVGTCHFYINRKNFIDSTTDGKNLIGTADIADLVQDTVSRFQKWGTVTYPGGSLQVGTVIPATGNMGCFPGNWDTPWRIQENQP